MSALVNRLRSRPGLVTLGQDGPGAITVRVQVPELWDAITVRCAEGTSCLALKQAALDAFGRATSRFALPPGLPSGLAGWTFHHAALTLDPSGVADVSQAVPVTTIR